MKNLGNTNLTVSNQGLGCMSMSEFYGDPISDEQGIHLFKVAYNNGINFFDTADVYGYGRNEILVGKAVSALKAAGINRNKVIIATKCGIIRDELDATKRGVDNSYQYIKDCCEKSLDRLGDDIENIDLFYLHRIAQGGKQIDESMKAMSDLLLENKIKSVGLSEASAEVIQQANDSLLRYSDGKHQLSAVQSEYSLMTRNVEHNGVLALCNKLNITFVAYSPLSRALLTGEIVDPEKLDKDDFRKHLPRFQKENIVYNNAIILKVREIANQKNCSVAQIALAWVMQHDNVIPIFGTTKEKNLLNNIQSQCIHLSDHEIKLLNELKKPIGDRYTESSMKAFEFDE